MHTTLIVANRTVGGDALAAEVRRRLDAGPCRFHLLVPVHQPVAAAVAIGSAVGDAANMSPTASFEMVDERRAARDRLEFGLEWLRTLDATATGELSTDEDAVCAVARIVEAAPIDDVIVSTLPTPVSRWLRQDLPSRVQRRVKLPVTVVSARG
jgi:hypothetical protein